MEILPGCSMPGIQFSRLAYFFDFAGANAPRACAYTHMSPVLTYRPYRLDVGFRNFLRFIVRMTYLVAAQFSFAADFTCSRHDTPPLRIRIIKKSRRTIP